GELKMPRKLAAVGIVVVVALALAAFWFLTVPDTVPASALAPRTPDLANGKTMFHAGGCASCHAIPRQEDKTKLGGGLALGLTFGPFSVSDFFTGRPGGRGAWGRSQFLRAYEKGPPPGGGHFFPAFPQPLLSGNASGQFGALFAFLKGFPAVAGKVRDHALP